MEYRNGLTARNSGSRGRDQDRDVETGCPEVRKDHDTLLWSGRKTSSTAATTCSRDTCPVARRAPSCARAPAARVAVAFASTSGNVADITLALPLLRIVVPPKRLIADKAYDTQSLRNGLKSHRVIATIRSTPTRTVPYKHRRIAYRRRNRIERRFGRLKNWRT
jgi:IS5 family transposase